MKNEKQILKASEVNPEIKPITKGLFYGWWILLACFGISMGVGGIVVFGFTAFIEPLREEFGWSYAQISFAVSLRGVEMGIFSPFVGFLVDRFGSRKMLLSGIFTVGLGLILLSYTQSIAMFYASFVLLAFGAGGCTSVVLMVTIVQWFEKNIGIALGIMMSGFGAGGLMVPFIVYLIDIYHWRATFIILGLGIWIIGIPLSLVIRDKPEQYGCFPDEKLPNNTKSYSENHTKKIEINFKEMLKSKTFLYLNITEAIRMLVCSTVIVHIMPYLSTIGISRPTAGLIAASIPLVSIAGRIGLGWLGDVFDKRYVIAMSFGLIGLGLLALNYMTFSWFILLFILLFSVGFGGVTTLRGAILREYFGKAYFGKLLGILMGSAAIGGIIGPSLAGWVFDTMGSYHLIWIAFSGFIAIAAGLILRVKPSLMAKTVGKLRLKN